MRPPAQPNRMLLNQPVSHPLVQGDPATQRFAVFMLGTLVVVTIGSIIGIIAGNAAHYDYFGPNNKTTIPAANLSSSVFLERYIGQNARLWIPLNERWEQLNSSRKTRRSSSAIEKTLDNRR